MSKDLRIALDRSARRIDVDGRLHVDRSRISKAAVNPYYGQEIPGWQALGLQADKVYRLFRDPVELERAAATFERLPILSKHVPVTAAEPQPDLVVGAIGSAVTFEAPYLNADLCVWDAKAIAGIETDAVKELSCAYRYVPVMEPGEYEGQPYDGRMTEIAGNHLALVEVGRAGSDVVVADRNPFKKEPAMLKNKLGKALFVALCAASPVLAADSALPAFFEKVDRKSFNKDALKAKLIALDSDIDPNQVDNIVDAIMGIEDNPVASPAPGATDDVDPAPAVVSKADQLRQLLAGKVDDETMNAACGLLAADEGDEDDKKLEAAMDSMRAEFRDANDARVAVRPIVGDVIGMDSAADIYGFALDHMKVERKGVEGSAALKSLFAATVAARNVKTAPAPSVIAQDAAGVEKAFPGLARIRVG